jgi:hypothetical protein
MTRPSRPAGVSNQSSKQLGHRSEANGSSEMFFASRTVLGQAECPVAELDIFDDDGFAVIVECAVCLK